MRSQRTNIERYLDAIPTMHLVALGIVAVAAFTAQVWNIWDVVLDGVIYNLEASINPLRVLGLFGACFIMYSVIEAVLFRCEKSTSSGQS